MRSTFVAVTLACIGGATFVEARGFDYGPRIAFSFPTQEAAELLEPSVGYGVTGTFVGNSRRGVGVDIAYHRWPASSDVDRSLDELFSAITGEPISGSRTTVSVVQATLHTKVFAVERGPVLPWMKIGVGVYRFNSKLELPIAALQAAGARVERSDPDHISYEVGYQAGVGLDLQVTPDTKLSLDASYQLVATREPFFTVFTIGACLLAGPR